MIAVCVDTATWRDLQHALLLRRKLPQWPVRELGIVQFGHVPVLVGIAPADSRSDHVHPACKCLR